MRGGLLVVATLLACAPHVEAQWVLEAQGGRLRQLPGAVPAADAVFGLGVSYSDPVGGFRATAGVPARSGEPYWGSLGGWSRMTQRVGAFSLGMDLSAQGTFQRDQAGGLEEVPGLFGPRLQPVPATSAYTLGGQGLPLVAFESGRLRLQARGGAAHLYVARGEAHGNRTVPMGDLQLSVLLSDGVAVAPVVRRFWEPGDRVSDYAGATAVLASGPVSLTANLGQWIGVPEAETPWSASATIRPTGRLILTAGARHDGYDPVSRQPPQTAFSLSAGFRLGRARSAAAIAPVSPVGRDGRAVIRLPVSASAGVPRIAGDFTGWTPQPMQREGSHWTYALPLLAGVYHYAFVAADGTWFVPEATPGRRSDGMGGHVAVVVVP